MSYPTRNGMEEEYGWRWLWLGKMKKESIIMCVCVCLLGEGGGVSFFLFPIFLEEAAEDGLKASPGVNKI